ncbi:KTSC domain-containing protein [Streptomyces sp. SID13031]|nr:KTSC domain-containing protein [Streptomyces sp. SID13031]
MTSASVKSVGYDVSSGTLELEYANGSVYQYFEVPQPTYAGLLAAPSIGNYVNTKIKPYFDSAEV